MSAGNAAAVVPVDLTGRANVPCGSCSACCHSDAVPLHPGDDQTLDTEESFVPGYGVVAILRKVDGHCVYLQDGKCSIWERAPVVCRVFDCRRFFLSRDRATRRRGVKEGVLNKAVLDAGRDRLHTLP